jgi:DNA-3-methyladenine glycosylase II
MDDPNPWQEAERHIGAADPVMAALVERHAPCRLKRDRVVFEGLLRAIVSQQLSVKTARTIYGRFADLFPDGLTPEAVLEAPVETLRGVGFSRAKAAYAHDLAAHVLDGRLELGRLDELADEDVIAALTAVKGIGRWTAEMILMFDLARPDILPVADLGIREGFRRAYNLPERPDAAEMTRIAEPWRPWRSIGSWYLWRVLDNEPNPASPSVETDGRDLEKSAEADCKDKRTGQQPSAV